MNVYCIQWGPSLGVIHRVTRLRLDTDRGHVDRAVVNVGCSVGYINYHEDLELHFTPPSEEFVSRCPDCFPEDL